MNAHIAMIGAGNMAQALIGGLLRTGHPADALTAADPNPQTREHIQRQFGINTHADNADAVADADVIVLAVKPQLIDRVLESLADSVRPEAVVISVAAGTPVERLKRALKPGQAIVRVMPNTPALIGLGATGLYADHDCSDDQRRLAEWIFNAVGEVAIIEDEMLMDAVTAVSGSGPAYFFALAEALSEAGVEAGLPPDTARLLARQTAAGAGAMLGENGADAATLRKQVTSPGGTTAAALDTFENQGFKAVVNNAVQAAVARGKVLGTIEPGEPQ